ncbi:MAG: lipopolysaccharide biosynthesis protein [Solirubrobacteraceae bacterium]
MRRDTAARLAADVFALAASLLTATLTAQALGPAGKGYLATLTLLVSLFVVVFEVGIGDALIVMVGPGRATLADAARATVQATLWLALVGTIAFAAVAVVVLGPVASADRLALALGAALVAVGVCYSTLVSVLLATQRVALVAAISALGAAVTAAVMSLAAIAFELDVEAAIFVSLCGAGIATAACVARLRAAQIAIKPTRAPGYLPGALRLGFAFQLPNLLIVAAARLDLLLVFEIGGAEAAGRYSVALTIGALVALVPTAVAYAGFARIANMAAPEARAFTGRALRRGMLGALASALLLAAVTPIGLPWVFGAGFRPAVGPTLILLAGGVLGSGQLLLARLTAARGEPRILIASFTLSFVVMIGLDLVLIEARGESGAAVAALISAFVGLSVAAALYRGRPTHGRTPSA